MAGPDHGDGRVTTTDSPIPDSSTAPRTVRRRVHRPAGPPAAEGATAPTDSVSTPARMTTPTPRKTAPIKQIRRKKSVPLVSGPAVATGPDVSSADQFIAASPQRSGAAMTYRERRRAGAPSSGGRVVTTTMDRSRLGLALAGTVAAALVIGLVVASVLFAMGTDRIDDRVSDRAQYSAFARQMIVNLTSLSPTTIDQVRNTYETETSGKAREQLQQSLQQTTDLVKSQGVVTKGTILSDAVVDSDADSATVMLVSGWTMNAPASASASGAPATDDQGPVVQTFRWKLTITKLNGAMKMTDIEWVT